MQNNPEMMKSMTKMMSSMKPETLASMSQQAGMNMTEEQAKQVTEKMKDLTPDQMATMMKWSQRIQTLMVMVKQLYDAMFGTAMRAAASVMMIAIFAAWLFGYA